MTQSTPKSGMPLKETQDYLAEVIAERDRLRTQLLGAGAQCSGCGFKYWEHKGHVIPCPVCELAACQEELAKAQEELADYADSAPFNVEKRLASHAEPRLHVDPSTGAVEEHAEQEGAFAATADTSSETVCIGNPAPSAASGLADEIEGMLTGKVAAWITNPGWQDVTNLMKRAAEALRSRPAQGDSRDAVIEECAKVADAYKDSKVLVLYERGPNDPPGNAYIPLTGAHIATAIRSLKSDAAMSQQEPTKEKS